MFKMLWVLKKIIYKYILCAYVTLTHNICYTHMAVEW